MKDFQKLQTPLPIFVKYLFFLQNISCYHNQNYNNGFILQITEVDITNHTFIIIFIKLNFS